jgi:hypothetical protein
VDVTGKARRWLAWACKGPRNIAHRIRSRAANGAENTADACFGQPQRCSADPRRPMALPTWVTSYAGETSCLLLRHDKAPRPPLTARMNAPARCERGWGAKALPAMRRVRPQQTLRVTRRAFVQPAMGWNEMGWDGHGGGEGEATAAGICGAPALVRRRVARRAYEEPSKLQYGREQSNRFCHVSTRRSPIRYTSISCSDPLVMRGKKVAVESAGLLIWGRALVSALRPRSNLAHPSRPSGSHSFEMCTHRGVPRRA